jgi:hypothetical protein
VGGAAATLASVKRAAQANSRKARAKMKKAKRHQKPRRTKRKVHRGTRWIKAYPRRTGFR